MSEHSLRTIVLLSSDETFADRVSAALYPHFQIIRGVPEQDNIENLIASCNPAACLIDIDGASWDRGPGIAMIASVRARWEHLPIIFATLDLSSSTVVPAFRTGANDVCDKDFASDELLAQMDRQANRHPTRVVEDAARFCAFVGAREGQGTTTAAFATAECLSRRANHDERVLILDYSHPPAVIPDIVGQRATYFMTDAVHDLPRLDDTMIDSAILRAPPGNLYVLPLASTESGLNSVGPEELMKLLTILRNFFAIVVADIAWPWRTQLAERLFAAANHRVLGVTQSVTSVHAATTFLNEIRESNGNDLPFNLMITRHDPNILPSVADLEKALGAHGTVFVVPEDRRHVDLARNAANPLTRRTPRSTFERSIFRLSEMIEGGEAGGTESRTGWRGLIGRVRPSRPDTANGN